MFEISAHLQNGQQEITVGCRSSSWLLKVDTKNVVRNGTEEHEVPVSLSIYSNWLIKVSHIKGSKPELLTAKLRVTLSGWGASLSCFISCLLKLAVTQLRVQGQGILMRKETPVLKSPDYLGISYPTGTWLPTPPLLWSRESSHPQCCWPPRQVQVVFCCLLGEWIWCFWPQSDPLSRWWWHNKLWLSASRSLGMCRCWYTCNKTFMVIFLLLTYAVQSQSSPSAQNATDRFDHLLIFCEGTRCISGQGGGDLGRRDSA